MTYSEFQEKFSRLPKDYKAKDIQPLIKDLISRNEDVSCLKEHLGEHPEYCQPYFEISLARIKDIGDKLSFVENHFSFFTEWWHADMLFRILGSKLKFDLAYAKAQEYVKSDNPIIRRWGYVMFVPRLTKDSAKVQDLLALLSDDDNEYAISAEASLIAFLAMTDFDTVYNYLSECTLDKRIISSAVGKICSSKQVPDYEKKRFKQLASR